MYTPSTHLLAPCRKPNCEEYISVRQYKRHPASFRDPLGGVFEMNGRILRGLSAEGALQYQAVKQSGFLNQLETAGRVVDSNEVAMGGEYNDPAIIQWLEHSHIPDISYPYEWPFLLLKEAALFHLRLQLDALASDVVLTDASAYNVQFQGVIPIFMDVLSFKSYDSGEMWKAHHQFCEQFLNPLLLSAIRGIPYHAWYRGALDGISTETIARLLPWRYWFSPRALVHILLPTRYQQARKHQVQDLETLQGATIPKAAYRQLLSQLYRWIDDLHLPSQRATIWADYDHTYVDDPVSFSLKKQMVSEFSTALASKNQHTLLLDLGCNTGEFAEIALTHGVSRVVGFDRDIGALHKAVIRAQEKRLNFLPLYQELTNTSPNQGWLLMERSGIEGRFQPNAVIALALIHHLVIGQNIPLGEAIDWLVSLAPCGLIEFIPKTDPMVQRLLALRTDIFPAYSQDIFTTLLQQRATIIQCELVSGSGRCIYWYERMDFE